MITAFKIIIFGLNSPTDQLLAKRSDSGYTSEDMINQGGVFLNSNPQIWVKQPPQPALGKGGEYGHTREGIVNQGEVPPRGERNQDLTMGTFISGTFVLIRKVTNQYFIDNATDEN